MSRKAAGVTPVAPLPSCERCRMPTAVLGSGRGWEQAADRLGQPLAWHLHLTPVQHKLLMR